jgi:hypothetical protein
MATDVICVYRNNRGMRYTQDELRDWLRSELDRTGLPQAPLAEKLGRDKSVVSKILSGDRNVRIHEVPIIEAYFRNGVASKHPNTVTIREINVNAGMGGGGVAINSDDFTLYEGDGTRGVWELPESYLRDVLNVRAENARLLPVFGDSMAPTLVSGDRVLVDTAFQNPSPPGIYALWDGIGVVVKRIEFIRGSDPPSIRIISDNPIHKEDTCPLEQARIIGRVVWRAMAIK